MTTTATIRSRVLREFTEAVTEGVALVAKLAETRPAAKGTCTRCAAQAAMPAPNPAPAGSLARIKAACSAHLLQFMR